MAAPTIDQYSGLDHKLGMGDASTNQLSKAPRWCNKHDRRRINAYITLAAYLENVARHMLQPDSKDPDKKRALREYGDPAAVVRRIVGAAVGRRPMLVVNGADSPLSAEPRIPAAPQAPPTDITGVEGEVRKKIYDAALLQWKSTAEAELDRWLALAEALPKLIDRQEWLRDWATADQYIAKIKELEAEAIVPLGDGIVVHGWDAEHKRPSTTIHHPEEYFPVLSATDQDRFPNTIHLAYTFAHPDDPDREMIRRTTWELVPVGPTPDGATPDTEAFGTKPLYLAKDQEWREACLFTDAVWDAKNVDDIYNITKPPAWYETTTINGVQVDADRVPTGLDFIPVVHFTHNLARFAHFGRSPITVLAQLFDEIAAGDTDEALAALWAAQPVATGSGLQPGTKAMELTPGKLVSLGPDGRMDTIEMGQNLEKVQNRNAGLRQTMGVNGSVPEVVMGRVEGGEIPSGVALAITLTPFDQMGEDAQEARDPKWRLSCKMVQRIAIQNGDETLDGSTDVYDATLKPGPFMPQDSAAMAALITELRAADALSQRGGVQMAAEIPETDIDDVDQEVAAARETMTDHADKMTAATEDPTYAIRFLNLTGRRQAEANGVDPQAGDVIPPDGSILDDTAFE